MALRPFTQADFLNLWRAVLPLDYTEGIENEAQGAGFDVPSLQAAIFAGFEDNLNISQQAYFLRQHSIQTGPTASSGAKARTTLQLFRAAPVLGDLLVNVGQVFLATATDSLGSLLSLGRFLAVQSVTLPAGSTGPVAVEVEAEFEGYTGNVWPGVIAAFEPQGRLTVPAIVTATNEVRRSVAPNEVNADRFNLGLLGRMIRFVPVGTLTTPDADVPRKVVGAYLVSDEVALQFDPPLDPADVLEPVRVEVEEMADLGVTVTQPDPAVGGRVDGLSAISAERKIERVSGETDEAFAERLVELPDTVSPNAMERILTRVLTPFGIPWCLHETGEVDELMGFTWDLHPWDIGEPCGCGVTEPIGSELVGSGIVWMSEGTATRFFIVCVALTNVDDVGSAWDSDGPADFPAAWGEMVWDGTDAVFLSAIGRAYDAINAAREAGIGFTIVLDDSL
jgi:hypothetical protein